MTDIHRSILNVIKIPHCASGINVGIYGYLASFYIIIMYLILYQGRIQDFNEKGPRVQRVMYRGLYALNFRSLPHSKGAKMKLEGLGGSRSTTKYGPVLYLHMNFIDTCKVVGDVTV